METVPSPTDILNLTAVHDESLKHKDEDGTLMIVEMGNPVTQSHWFHVPSEQNFKNIGLVCKRPSAYRCGPRIYNISNAAGFVMPHVVKKDGLNVLVAGTQNCPKGWNYIDGSCFRLLTQVHNIAKQWKCSDALKRCLHYNSQGANVTMANKASTKRYLKMWMQIRKYGGIWLQNCSALVPDVSKRELQEQSFILVSNVSENIPFLNVLCETQVVVSIHRCGPSQFECLDKTCILEHHRCDQINDCINGEDEINCTCTKDMFKCRDNSCISASKYCNFVKDCLDGSDEHNCSHITNHTKPYRINSTKLPLEITIYDPRGEWFTNSTVLQNQEPYCLNETYVRCYEDYTRCIPRHHVCIYNDDPYYSTCPDRIHLHNCKHYQCPDMFKCPNAYCIPYHKLCDGVKDCEGGIDEENCTKFACPGLFRCRKEGICLDQKLRCDGHADCHQSYEDEQLCEEFICPTNCTCNQRSVDCSIDRISTIVTVPIETRSFNLSFNKLELESFPEMPYVYVIDLRNTSLRFLPDFIFQNCSNLKVLDLSWNFITHINMKSFHGLDKLSDITLHHNLIQYVEDSVFQSQTYLSFLDLSSNEIKYVEENTFTHLSIKNMVTDEFRFCCLAKQARQCHPGPDEFSSCDDLIKGILFKIVIWALGLLATFGNLFVIIWRCRYSQNYSGTIFVINLAISDFLMGIYLITIAAADLYYMGVYAPNSPQWRHSIICKFVGYISLVSSQVSVSMLVIITATKTYAILHPFKDNPFTGKVNLLLCVISWLLWSVLSLIPLIEKSYFGEEFVKNGTCLLYNLAHGTYKGWEYMNFIFLFFNALSFIYMSVAYISMYSSLNQSRHAAKRHASYEDRWMARKFILVVTTDGICWLPLIAASVYSLCGYNLDTQLAVWLSLFVLPVNSALNPYLYSYSTIKEHQAAYSF